MFWKKTVIGYPVTLLFVLSCALSTFVYAKDQFAYQTAMQTVYAAVYTAAAFATTLVFAVVLRKLAVQRNLRLSDKVSVRIAVLVIIAEGIFLLVRAFQSDAAPNPLYRMMATDYLETPSNIGTRTKLYLTLFSQIFSRVEISVSTVLAVQAAAFILAAIMVYFGVLELSGRMAAIFAVHVMLLYPQFTGITDEVSDNVFFWLMTGAGLLASSLYTTYAADMFGEYPVLTKGMIAAFTGIFLGVITGWDGGLAIFAVLPLYAFFARGAKPKKVILYYLIHLAAFAAGFYLCAHDPVSWAATYFSAVRVVMPMPLTTGPLYLLVLCSLAFFGAFAFFADKRFEKVTPWMLIAVYALLVGGQLPESGTMWPGFPLLMLVILAATGIRELARKNPVKTVSELKAAKKQAAETPAEEEEEKASIDDIAEQIVADYERALKRKEEREAAEAAAAATAAVAATATAAAADRVTEETVEEETVAEEVVAEETVEEETVVEETVEEETVVEETVEEETAAEETGEEETVAEETVEEETVVEEAVEEETVEEETAEETAAEEEPAEEEEIPVPEGMVLPVGEEGVDDETELHIRFDDVPGTYSIGLNRDGEVTETFTEEGAEEVEEEPAGEIEEITEEELVQEIEEAHEEAAHRAPDMSDFDLPFTEGDDFDI